MKRDAWAMPGLKSVAAVDILDLPPDLRMAALTEDYIPAVFANPDDIHFFGDAELSFERSEDKETATLTFQCSAERRFNDKALAFIVRNQSDESFLIGAAEPPFPSVRFKSATGASPQTKRMTEVTVAWPAEPVKVLVRLPRDARLPVR